MSSSQSSGAPYTLAITVPFRTQINLDSNQAFLYRSELRTTLETACRKMATVGSSKNFHTAWGRRDTQQMHYEKLDNLNLPTSATPLFSAVYPAPSAALATELNQLGQENEFSPVNRFEVEGLRFDFFNNTVGVAQYYLKVYPEHGSDIGEHVFTILDHATNEVSSLIISHFYNDQTRHCIALLQAELKKKKTTRKMIISNLNNSAFFDIHRNYEKLERPIWTNRLIRFSAYPEGEEYEILKEWLQADPSNTKCLEEEGMALHSQPGNSLVVDPKNLLKSSKIPQSQVITQYYFTIFHIMNINLQTVYAQTNSQHRNVEGNRLLSNAITNAFDHFKIEYGDLMYDLQGLDLYWVSGILSSWSFDELRNQVSEKAFRSSERAQEIRANKRVKYARFAELSLAAIGILSLMDTSINLVEFSGKDASKDNLTGLVDLVSLIPADGILYGVSLITVLFIFVFILKD